jgi:FKBP-type peptidyl-prolyl cis-trans isomerase FkpA
MRVFLGVTVLLTVLFSSCATYTEEEKSDFDSRIKTYLEKKNIQCQRSSSGLYYKIIEPGEGPQIQLQDEVTFTYKGTFLNGKVFDSPETPVTFQVQQLIAAWKEIMLQLKPGGKAFLVSPPQLGYGEHELDDIPANSVLVFELEVVSVR